MPTGLSSALLAPKGQLMKHSTAVILPVLLLPIVVVLLASSCEGRGLPVHGKVRSSSKSNRLPGKVGISERIMRGLTVHHLIIESLFF
jgi:hypothetical protein